jgi:hypothetical protein
MSFSAVLNLGGDLKNVTVLQATYEFSQPIDMYQRPKSRVEGGIITLEVESDNKTVLASWMLSNTMQKSGEIIFSKRDSGASLKTITFKDAYCVYYKESFNSDSDKPMTIQLKLSAKEIIVNSVSLLNNWPETQDSGSTGTTNAAATPSTSSTSSISSFNPLD